MNNSALIERSAKVKRLKNLKTELDQQAIPAFVPGRDLLEKYREAVGLVIELVSEHEREATR